MIESGENMPRKGMEYEVRKSGRVMAEEKEVGVRGPKLNEDEGAYASEVNGW